MQSLIRSLSLLLVVSAASGCIALAVGAAGGAVGITYVKGKLSDSVDGTVLETYTAALAVLDAEGLPLYQNEHSGSVAKLQSEYPDDKNIWIDIEAISAATSKITIRVGASGNQTRSVDLLDAIKARL